MEGNCTNKIINQIAGALAALRGKFTGAVWLYKDLDRTTAGRILERSK